METLLRYVNARGLTVLIILAGAVSAGQVYRRDITRRYMAWRYPPLGASGPLGREILDSAEERERRKVAAMHERVLGLLAKSREEGFDVSRLEPAAAQALRLNVKRRRPEAVRILNQLQMDIPRKRVQYIPMNPEEEKLDIPADVQPAPPRKHAPKRKSKAQRSQDLD